MVAGYSIGGGHVLRMMCDLTIAAENAIFGRTGSYLLTAAGRFVYGAYRWSKRVKSGFLCRRYDAQRALDMG